MLIQLVHSPLHPDATEFDLGIRDDPIMNYFCNVAVGGGKCGKCYPVCGAIGILDLPYPKGPQVNGNLTCFNVKTK
jgi:hypothetical protein